MYESDEGIQIDKDSLMNIMSSSGDDSPRERTLKPRKPR